MVLASFLISFFPQEGCFPFSQGTFSQLQETKYLHHGRYRFQVSPETHWTGCLSTISVLEPSAQLQPNFTAAESLNRQQHPLGAYVHVCILVPAHQHVPVELLRALITASAADPI